MKRSRACLASLSTGLLNSHTDQPPAPSTRTPGWTASTAKKIVVVRRFIPQPWLYLAHDVHVRGRGHVEHSTSTGALTSCTWEVQVQ